MNSDEEPAQEPPVEGLPARTETIEPQRDGGPKGSPSGQLLDRVLRLENERIASNDRRTEVALQAVKASDESDRRQFDFQMARLNSATKLEERRDGHARIILYAGGIFAVLVISLFLGMVFFGDPGQQAHALSILKLILTGGAGWGIVSGVLRLGKKLMRGFGDEGQDTL